MPSDNEVLLAAQRVRNAVENIDRGYWERLGIDRFPRGACGHCSELLGCYLHEVYAVEAEYVACDLYTDDDKWMSSHAWVEWNGLIIDISGDQFGWPPVIVSRTSPFHVGARPNTRHGHFMSESSSELWSAVTEYLKEA